MPPGDRPQPVEGLNSGFFFRCPQKYKPAGEDRFSVSVRVRKKEGGFSLEREEKLLRPSVYFLNGGIRSVLNSRITLNFNVG